MAEFSISAGDRVTILVPSGTGYRPKTGRAVMRGPAGWVLNMGGPHGTPAIASAENIVAIRKSRTQKSTARSSQAGS